MRFGNIYMTSGGQVQVFLLVLDQRFNKIILGYWKGKELEIVTEMSFEVKQGTNDMLLVKLLA